ncbi:uncharacterized protein MONOS_13783 [Monocercomonoides exilis]|uniref:uncharacterized protein n=1 Tax=Monocercomonoides exilis TaxID=2049356 RepID=UPI00355A0A97|nr:hypothetical protein MONOS_13783 [Monocercomonoides exilis]|eukprot:MONOS_13783.1-p1 / transcript=MONOS_13783.1 / gene=MONOS_13783 / organism=Monocercomonoides_exilis_PA203 / gene_product=unspecified product / transcript_product=unspecified product / location=Mono_scaffold00882:20941-23106(-) / protein_length=721 / sequence_SO=supercontig / SO=protein_coding / is_pseudo=false
MDIEAECEQTETALPIIPAASNLDDRCIRESYGSCSSNEQQEIRFPSITAREIEMPELELQGIICNQSSTQPFQIHSSSEQSLQLANQIRQYNSGFQYQSMECRNKPQDVADENMDICSEQSHSDKSPTLARDEECQSRCSIQAKKRGRLLHKTRRAKRDHGKPQSQNNVGCVRNEREHESGQMVRPRKHTQRRRTPSIMAKRRYFSPSSDSVNSPNDCEINRGKCTCSSSDARLERADMGTTDKNVETLRMEMERTEPGFEGRKMDETDGSKSTTRQNENSPYQSLESQGEEWFRRMLLSKGYSERVIDECKNSVAENTWKGYSYSYARFSEIWEDNRNGDPQEAWSNWVEKCAHIFISLKDKGTKASTLKQTCAALSLISELLYNRGLGESALMQRLLKSFRRSENRKKRDKPDIWNPQLLLQKITSLGENRNLDFHELTKKAICTCMLFSACRFTELERINLHNSTIGDDAIKLDSSLKTSTERTDIIIPFLKEQPLVCPAASVKELWNRIKESQPNATSLFIDETTHLALSARKIRNYAAEMLQDAGIPKCFGPYSLKHASITALTMAGIPLAQIAKFARLSPRSNTITKHYVQSDVSSKLAHVIARCNSTVLQPEESGSASESDSDSEAESDSETNSSSRSEEQIPTREICENGDQKQQTEFAYPDKVEEPEDNEEYNASQTVISEAKIEFIIRTRSQRRKELEKKQYEEKNIIPN